jgi:hypothetical protein
LNNKRVRYEPPPRRGGLRVVRHENVVRFAQLAPTIFGAGDPQAVRSWQARLLRFEPWRFEAALHALATAGEMRRLDEVGLPTEFLLRVTEPERWHAIEAAVERLRRLGLASTHEDLDDVYRGAVAEGRVGRSSGFGRVRQVRCTLAPWIARASLRRLSVSRRSTGSSASLIRPSVGKRSRT